MSSIRIASGSGFWGDWLEAPRRQLLQGEVDVLVLDYLAEVTMSVLAKQQKKNPAYGFAQDFVRLIEGCAARIKEKNTLVISNAGGINPLACGQALQQVLKRQGITLKIAVIEGDNLFARIDELRAKGETFAHFENGASFDTIAPRLLSANAYLGCASIVEAIAAGAQIIVTGRVADAALALAPMVQRFGWAWDDWDRLAAGTVAGHVLECGAQASGGNDSFDWQSVPDLANIGYPIVEMFPSGEFDVYKHPSTGGRISRETVIQQLIYEIGDPKRYMVPDVTVDFTTLRLEQGGEERVRVRGVQGSARPSRLKVSCSYADGYMAAGTMLYSWPQAARKAELAADIVKRRLAASAVMPARIHAELIGVNACFGSMSPAPSEELPEVQLRIAAHDQSREIIERFSREIAPLVLNGPPFATAYAAGRGKPSEVFAYWPTTVAREHVEERWELIDG